MIETTDDVTDLLCTEDAGSADNLPPECEFVAYSDNLLDTDSYYGANYFVGIAIDGVRFEYPYKDSKWDEEDEDDPKDFVWNHFNRMDMCLTTTTDDNILAFHTISPCIKSYSHENTPDLCEDDSLCDTKYGQFYTALNAWETTSDHGGILGLARDGHPIYGPYNSNGELWECDEHDVCNGVFFSNGMYAYVATSTFPYIIGCYGPGTVQYEPVDEDCSVNRCWASSLQLGSALGVLVALHLL